jgi:ABC-type lipoprotein export system ATPase subunit
VILTCANLTKTYRTERGPVEAVRGVDFVAHPGEFVSVVGRSGSGKSSFLAMIGGLSRPTIGEVCIDGVEIWRLGESGLAKFRNRRIGFIYQFASLLPSLRVVDNVALPALLGKTREPAGVYRDAYPLLEQFGLGDRVRCYPSELSSGEQRRVVIARALINAPAVVLADEPTSDLDEATERVIVDRFRELVRARAITLVMVTHNRHLAEQTDRVLNMADGRLCQRNRTTCRSMDFPRLKRTSLLLVCGGTCRRSAHTRLTSQAVLQHLLAILTETPRR